MSGGLAARNEDELLAPLAMKMKTAPAHPPVFSSSSSSSFPA
jgi:hypothetical protein